MIDKSLVINKITKMEVYKYKKLENGDIYLEKFILEKTNFTIVEKENGDILMKKIASITISEFSEIKKFDFKKSTIMLCIVNGEEETKLKYKSILDTIYNIINDGIKIIKHTKLNMKTIKKVDDGFYHLENLGISVQCCESNKCILEIVNQCIENEISLSMKIKLADDTNLNLVF